MLFITILSFTVDWWNHWFFYQLCRNDFLNRAFILFSKKIHPHPFPKLLRGANQVMYLQLYKDLLCLLLETKAKTVSHKSCSPGLTLKLNRWVKNAIIEQSPSSIFLPAHHSFFGNLSFPKSPEVFFTCLRTRVQETFAWWLPFFSFYQLSSSRRCFLFCESLLSDRKVSITDPHGVGQCWATAGQCPWTELAEGIITNTYSFDSSESPFKRLDFPCLFIIYYYYYYYLYTAVIFCPPHPWISKILPTHDYMWVFLLILPGSCEPLWSSYVFFNNFRKNFLKLYFLLLHLFTITSIVWVYFLATPIILRLHLHFFALHN